MERKQWEYRYIEPINMYNWDLDQLGAEGWEAVGMVSVAPAGAGKTAVLFKREKLPEQTTRQ